MTVLKERLAIDGGDPVRTRPFPTINDALGRDVGDAELALLEEVIRSGKLNRNNGTKVSQLEREWATAFGAAGATASTSGTAAIHVALGALPLNPGDEVIVTPITDWGSIGPILAQGCVPVFADVDPRTYGLDPASVASRVTSRTRAILAVHLLGHPCDLEAIQAIAAKHDLYLIEDCAQAMYATWRGRTLGTFGHLGCFSLQQSKVITTGDGGMTIARDEALSARAALFADKGWPRAVRQSGRREHRTFGLNYRMTELQGAVGLAQLAKAPGFLAKRRAAAAVLAAALRDVPGIQPAHVAPEVSPAHWFHLVSFDKTVLDLDQPRFLAALRAEGIPAGPVHSGDALHLIDMFQTKQVFGTSHYPFDYAGRSLDDVDYSRGTCPVAEELADPARSRSFLLPSNEGVSEEDAADMARAIRKVALHHAR
ncbi:MAG TPA: DegT/DnrJ/EryC1/StrS family aminotransferase [Chloroflexota bacterium]|nr:DegT/DnrJ/EryC1/StrS family aminotransferase [Chloroflexota bacterium]